MRRPALTFTGTSHGWTVVSFPLRMTARCPWTSAARSVVLSHPSVANVLARRARSRSSGPTAPILAVPSRWGLLARSGTTTGGLLPGSNLGSASEPLEPSLFDCRSGVVPVQPGVVTAVEADDGLGDLLGAGPTVEGVGVLRLVAREPDRHGAR